jgi:hypothetical protein
MPLDAVKSVEKVWEKCAKSVQAQNSRESAAGPGVGPGGLGSLEDGVGTRDRDSGDSALPA